MAQLCKRNFSVENGFVCISSFQLSVKKSGSAHSWVCREQASYLVQVVLVPKGELLKGIILPKCPPPPFPCSHRHYLSVNGKGGDIKIHETISILRCDAHSKTVLKFVGNCITAKEES